MPVNQTSDADLSVNTRKVDQASVETVPGFYDNLYPRAVAHFAKARGADSTDSVRGQIAAIIRDRLSSKNGLDPEDVATLLTVVRDDELRDQWRTIIEAARQLRTRTYGTSIATMVPIEIGSYCASNCTFCGWRRDNSAMLRLRVTKAALISQVKHLAALGFTHFELSGGDDLLFLQRDLYDVVKTVKLAVTEAVDDGRLSICLTPLMQCHYDKLAQLGLDTVLTWQETYDRNTFERLISKGPKAQGIDDNFRLVRGGDGFLSRVSSHERAAKAGLQVGIGVMLGLAPEPEADILATVLHGHHLLKIGGDAAKPLIIGMPTWNAITTPASDMRSEWQRPFDPIDVFEIISAIYLLSFPDYKAWVFPNCRVPIATQLRSAVAAGVFTSTMVRVGPGAYLAELGQNSFDGIFQASSLLEADLTSSDVLQGEQFKHHFHEHDAYIKAFEEAGLTITSDTNLLTISRQAKDITG